VETAPPFLAKCDICGEILLDVCCIKCAVGGLICAEGNKEGLGQVADLKTKPIYWTCSECKSKWRIPKQTYENNPIVIKSALEGKEKGSAVENIKKGVRLNIKERGRKLLLIAFLASSISMTISNQMTKIVFFIFFLGALFNVYKKKDFFRLGLSLILGGFLGAILRSVIFE
jgi:hypothetical protein